MKPKEVQKKLNMLCPGLGDAWMDNYNGGIKGVCSLHACILYGFAWHKSNEGYHFWDSIFGMLFEMEQAELI